MIKVKELAKHFDKLTALYDISFNIPKGGRLGILGMNSSGKSTLLNILGGRVSPTSGSFTVEGFDCRKDSKECRRRIGYMPENPPIYSDMTVREYLIFACELKKLKKSSIPQEMERLRKLTELTADDDIIAADLADIDKRKLSLCQALAGDPPILLLDDPLKGLEGARGEELLSVIKGVIGDKTVVFASRNLSECSEICDNEIIINRGRIAVNSSLAALSAEISDCTRIKVRVLASRSAARNVFASIREITDIELHAADEKGAMDITVTYPSSCDLREAMWRTTQQAGIPVLEMKQLNISLEDIYLQISGER